MALDSASAPEASWPSLLGRESTWYRDGGLSLLAVLVVAGSACATYSVVRYRVWIVAVYTVLAVVLALVLVLTQARSSAAAWVRLTVRGKRSARWAARWGGPVGAAVPLVAASVGTQVPTFTYLTASAAGQVHLVLSLSALGCAALLALGRRHVAVLVLGLATAAHLGATALLIHGDPSPDIDVWYTLQAGADALLHGQSFYDQTWIAPPGVMAAFTYLPWTAVLVAPARLLTGDVRWALSVATVVGAWAMLGACRPLKAGRPADAARMVAGLAALVLLLPGTSTQIEQAWTEPLLFATISLAVLAWRRGWPLWSLVALAIGLACKQHLALLLVPLAAWPRLGVRRTAVLAVAAAGLMLPWMLGTAADMFTDTVALLVHYPPMRFADSWFVVILNESGTAPPLWATGLLLTLTLTLAAWFAHRRNPGTATMIGLAALTLFVASLLNKQAFYNQYWLVAALCALALGTAAGTDPDRVSSESQR